MTIPKYAKMAINNVSHRSSDKLNELERKDSLKRASSSNPREKDQEIQEASPGLEDKIQTQNNEILHKKQYKDHNNKEKPNLSFLLKYGDNKEKGTFQDINLVRCFGSKVVYLWKLWELVLTNQPLLIISDTPTKCRY